MKRKKKRKQKNKRKEGGNSYSHTLTKAYLLNNWDRGSLDAIHAENFLYKICEIKRNERCFWIKM